MEPLTVREARSREPLLSPGISCAFDIPADHQVDPRRLLARIARSWPANREDRRSRHGFAAPRRRACCGRTDGWPGSAWPAAAPSTAGRPSWPTGSVPPASAACRPGCTLPLRPVYGDILRLRVPGHLQPLLTSTVRGLVRGVPVYIVPRQDGTVVIGATQREDAARRGPGARRRAVSAGGVYQLLRDAQQLLPAVAELELLEATARARPGTPDNAPLLGRVAAARQDGGDIPGLIIATGFFRHGVLLTPAAAAICRQLLDGDERPALGPVPARTGFSGPPARHHRRQEPATCHNRHSKETA